MAVTGAEPLTVDFKEAARPRSPSAPRRWPTCTLLSGPGNILAVTGPAAGVSEVPVQASVPQRVKDQEHRVVPGQQPGFRYQAIAPIDALLVTSWMHQPVTDLGHHVRAVQDSALTLTLI